MPWGGKGKSLKTQLILNLGMQEPEQFPLKRPRSGRRQERYLSSKNNSQRIKKLLIYNLFVYLFIYLGRGVTGLVSYTGKVKHAPSTPLPFKRHLRSQFSEQTAKSLEDTHVT